MTRLPGGQRVVCGAFNVREEDGHDWLDFVLPVGALARAEPRVGAYPFDEDTASLAWRRPVDEWLAAVALRVFSVVPFRVAAIGFEASGMLTAADLDAGIPAERWCGIVAAGDPPVFHRATY